MKINELSIHLQRIKKGTIRARSRNKEIKPICDRVDQQSQPIFYRG